jgi:hypothetical protein
MPTDHLDDLRTQAQYARERYQLYKAKAYGQRPTSPERLRELQRAYEQAEARLHFAEAEEQRARKAASISRNAADAGNLRSCAHGLRRSGRPPPTP